MTDQLNILYTCDNAYLSLTSISMASVVHNNKDSLITFYIASESEDSDNYRRLVDFYKDNENVKIRYLDCTKYDDLLASKDLDKWGSGSFYVYWKLFAYDFLDCDYVWYLDSDVLCLNKITDPGLNKAVGACLDSAHECFNRLAHINENYYLFNTGSLFVDVRKWKEKNCSEKVLDYISTMEHKPLLCDQDILSIALQDDIQVLAPEYDYLAGYDYYGVHNSFEMYSLNKKPFYSEKEIEDAKDKIVFYHCLGGVFGRPWEKGNNSPVNKEFSFYRSLSAWPEYETERNDSTLFKIERMLEILPDSIYNRIHNFAIRKYLERQAQQ